MFLLLLVAAGMMAKYCSEIVILQKNALSERDVSLRYVGELETIVSRTGIQHGSTHFDAGLGIGIANDAERNELLKKLRPVVYLPFAKVLDVTKTQVAEVARAGPDVRVMLHGGEVLALSGPAGEVLSYEGYVARVQTVRERWRWGAWIALAAAVLYFVAATIAARRLRIAKATQ